MEIPLALRERRDGRLVAKLPAAYRVSALAVLAALTASLVVSGGPPGPIGWAILAIVALGCLYEERWTFDPAARLAVHRSGLIIIARKTKLAFDDIASVRLAPFVRGTVPGSSEEAAENEAALSGGGPYDALPRRRLFAKKRYICMLLEGKDGTHWFVDAATARALADLRSKASRIAGLVGAPLNEG